MAAGTIGVDAHKGYGMAADHTTEEFQLFPCHTVVRVCCTGLCFAHDFHQHPVQSNSNGDNLLDPLTCERRKHIHKTENKYFTFFSPFFFFFKYTHSVKLQDLFPNPKTETCSVKMKVTEDLLIKAGRRRL